MFLTARFSDLIAYFELLNAGWDILVNDNEQLSLKC